MPDGAAIVNPKDVPHKRPFLLEVLECVPMDRIFAWLGALLVVAAICYTGYFYYIVLRRADATPGVDSAVAIAINSALFDVFALHHSLLARASVKRWLTRMIPPRMERSLYVWIASALLIGVCVLWQSVPGMIYSIQNPWRWPFYGLLVVGLGLASAHSRWPTFTNLPG